jgi:hypothetical protein
MKYRALGALGALTMVAVVGCERRDMPRPEETRPVAPPAERVTEPAGARAPGQPAPEIKGTASQAVEAITNERCAREERCGNLGAGKKFASKEDCTSRTRSDWSEDLNAYECPAGIEQDELNECLQEIRNDSCGNPFDTLERFLACRASDICLNVR